MDTDPMRAYARRNWIKSRYVTLTPVSIGICQACGLRLITRVEQACYEYKFNSLSERYYKNSLWPHPSQVCF